MNSQIILMLLAYPYSCIIHIVAGICIVQQMCTIYQKLNLVDVHVVVNIQFISYKFCGCEKLQSSISPICCYNILHIFCIQIQFIKKTSLKE